MKLTIGQRLTEFRNQMNSVQNLNRNKTAGDMKFFIFDYNPKDELRVRDETYKAIRSNPEIVQFDLYEMMIDIIKENGYFDTVKSMEKDYEKSLLLNEVFQPMLALEQTGNEILNRFSDKVKDDGKHIV